MPQPAHVPDRSRRSASVGAELNSRNSSHIRPFLKNRLSLDPNTFHKLRMENKRSFMRNDTKITEAFGAYNNNNSPMQNVPGKTEVASVINKCMKETPKPPVLGPQSVDQSDPKVCLKEGSSSDLNANTSTMTSVKRKLDTTESCVVKRPRRTFDDCAETLSVENVGGTNTDSPKIRKRPQVIRSPDVSGDSSSSSTSICKPRVTTNTFLTSKNNPALLNGNGPLPGKRDHGFHNHQTLSYQNNRNASPYHHSPRNKFDMSPKSWFPPNDNRYQDWNDGKIHDSRRGQNMRTPFPNNRNNESHGYHSIKSASVKNESLIMSNSMQDDSLRRIPTGSMRVPAARTPAQDRLLRIQSSLSEQSTPKNQSTEQQKPQSHSWPRQKNWRPQSHNHQNIHTPKNCSSAISDSPKTNTPHNSESLISSQRNELHFVHPSGINSSSPIQRERSHSASSGMSTDSSPTFRFLEASQNLRKKSPSPWRNGEVAPSNASSKVLDAENTMEWEPIATAVIVKKVAEIRQAVTSSNEGIQLPRNCSLDLTPNLNTSVLVLVLDTNVFLGAMAFVSRVRDHHTPVYGYPLLYVPWQVVQELDTIKDRCTGDRGLKQRVTEAIKFIQHSLKHRSPRIVFQDFDTMDQSSAILAHDSPDDRILAACLQLKILLATVTHQVVFVSEDVNLRNKAIINEVKSKSVSEISEIVFHSKALSEKTQPESKEEIQLQGQLDYIFCWIKSNLFELMSKLLINAMQLKMGSISWEKGVVMKPPWDWKKIFHNYNQHYISFSELVTCSDMRHLLPTIKSLKSIILKHEEDSQVTSDNVKAFVKETFTFLGKLKPPKGAKMQAELRVLQTKLSDLTSHHVARPTEIEIQRPTKIEKRSVSPASIKPKVESPARPTSNASGNLSTSSLSSNNSPATPNVEEAKVKLFCSLDSLYIQLEGFRLSAYKFLKMDPKGSTNIPIADITLHDLEKFSDIALQTCRLKVCLEKLFGDPQNPPAFTSSNIFVEELFSILTQQTQNGLTLEQLVAALQDASLYAQMSEGGLSQFIVLCDRYEFLSPIVNFRIGTNSSRLL